MQISALEPHERSYKGSSGTFQFLLSMHRNFRLSGQNTTFYEIEKLNPALNYMEKYLGDPIFIEEIAHTMNWTPQHFCQMFKKTFNQRPLNI